MKRAVFHGFLASLALVSLYFVIMRVGSGSWDYTTSELIRLRFWIVPLITGFGIQVGLFSYLKNCAKMTKLGNGTVATGTATSSVAMLVCCAHHLTDILPFLGLSALSLVLVRYQVWFLALGVLSNLVGISLMIRLLKKRRYE